MMAMMTPYIPFDEAETTLSYAARLASEHTGMPMTRLLKDLGIRQLDFENATPDAVTRFAESVGEGPERLQQGAVRIHRKNNSFRGEDCTRRFMTARIRSYCHHCLLEDGEPESWKHRILWCIHQVSVCPLHMCELTLIDSEKKFVDIRELVTSRADLKSFPGHRGEIAVPDWVHWLMARLAGESETGWFADQTLEHVIASSEMLGAVLEYGVQVKVTDLSPSLRGQAIERGYSVYRDGQESVRLALDEIRRRSTGRAVQAGPLAIYGALFDWLDRRSKLTDPGPIRSLLREHILEHTAVAKGENILGERTIERRYHSIKSLSEASGIHRRRLSRLLQKRGYVPEGATDAESGNLIFPAEEFEVLLREIGSAIPLDDLAHYIGASQNQTQVLYKMGIIKPLFPSSGRGSVRKVVFGRTHLDGFLARVSAIECRPEDSAGEYVTLAEASRRVGIFMADLFKAIKEKRLSVWRAPDVSGLRAVLVRLPDIEQLRDQLSRSS